MPYDPAFIETLRKVRVHPNMKYSRSLIDFVITEAEANTVTTTPQEAFEKSIQLNAALLSSEIDCISAISDLDAVITKLQIQVAALGAQVAKLTKSNE